MFWSTLIKNGQRFFKTLEIRAIKTRPLEKRRKIKKITKRIDWKFES